VELDFVVGAKGEVVRAEGRTNVRFAEVGACVAAKARRWTFPEAGTETHANVPFVFSALAGF
jgi:hypothetical protein